MAFIVAGTLLATAAARWPDAAWLAEWRDLLLRAVGGST
jgi:hypothetical protein